MMQNLRKMLQNVLFLIVLLLLFVHPCLAADESLHPAYLTGFSDGTLRPEEALTREQLAQALYRLIPEEAKPAAGESCFSDVPRTRWSYEAVTALSGLGVLYGTPEGAFKPEEGVSGEMLAAVLMRIAASEAGETTLSTLAAGWRAQEISFEAGNGWVMGLDGTHFCPDEPLTRGRFAQILNRLLDRTPSSLDDLCVGMPLWSDNLDTQGEYFLAMQEAAVTHTATCTGEAERWTGLG